jgi:hypothetical protein
MQHVISEIGGEMNARSNGKGQILSTNGMSLAVGWQVWRAGDQSPALWFV